jgi:hypothetical protein
MLARSLKSLLAVLAIALTVGSQSSASPPRLVPLARPAASGTRFAEPPRRPRRPADEGCLVQPTLAPVVSCSAGAAR